MFSRLAICAIIIAATSTSASATGYSWGNWSGLFNWNWSQSHNQWSHWDKKDKDDKKDKKDKYQKKSKKDKWYDCDDQQWEEDCDWGKDDKKDKKKKKHKKGKKDHDDKCDTPSAVPSPTAAIAGLGMMGLMLSRRRNRQA